jgi:hypothetical protein
MKDDRTYRRNWSKALKDLYFKLKFSKKLRHVYY